MPARYTAGMKPIASLCLLLALAGCGNKGPLVMADPASRDAVQPAVAPATVPKPQPASTEPVPAEPVPSTSGTPAR